MKLKKLKKLLIKIFGKSNGRSIIGEESCQFFIVRNARSVSCRAVSEDAILIFEFGFVGGVKMYHFFLTNIQFEYFGEQEKRALFLEAAILFFGTYFFLSNRFFEKMTDNLTISFKPSDYIPEDGINWFARYVEFNNKFGEGIINGKADFQLEIFEPVVQQPTAQPI